MSEPFQADLLNLKRRLLVLHVLIYPTGRNFHLNLNFAISLMANSLNLNSAYYFIF